MDEVGVPDELDRLWTPHRMAYINGEDRLGESYDKPAGCPFDRLPRLSDEEGLIVARGELVYAVLNLYPYNAGHVLICPYRHVADYTDLTAAETAEFSEFTKRAVGALRHASGAQGFNIGINLGSVAGAGIAAHLHQHVVPRWAATPTSCPSPRTPGCCPSSWPTPASSSLKPGRPPDHPRSRREPAAPQSGLESAATLAARCDGSASWRR